MTDDRTEVDRGRVASDFEAVFRNRLPPETIESVTAHLERAPKAAEAANTAYPATGSVASLVIWVKCQCAIRGGKSFDGSVWGLTFPGGGALFGDVYTDDVETMYAKTTHFVLVATQVYTTFIFLDDDARALGSLQAGSVSTVGGHGGGKGHWK